MQSGVSQRLLGAFSSVWLAVGCIGTSGEQAQESSAAPQGVTPLIEQAERAQHRHDFDVAISAYREALEQTPWNARLQRALAVAHADRAARSRDEGRLPAAERDLREALRLAPEDAEFEENLAVVLVERAALDLDEERAAERRREAQEIAPQLARSAPRVNASVERRLDLAFQLLERGQIEAGIERLSQLLAEKPERADVRVLLAQAYVRQGTEHSRRGNFTAAVEALDRAVELYGPLGRCDAGACRPDELRLAHHNRITALLNGSQEERARQALADAERLGLRFPELRRAVSE